MKLTKGKEDKDKDQHGNPNKGKDSKKYTHQYCGGTGTDPQTGKTCAVCGGTGEVG